MKLVRFSFQVIPGVVIRAKGSRRLAYFMSTEILGQFQEMRIQIGTMYRYHMMVYLAFWTTDGCQSRSMFL